MISKLLESDESTLAALAKPWVGVFTPFNGRLNPGSLRGACWIARLIANEIEIGFASHEFYEEELFSVEIAKRSLSDIRVKERSTWGACDLSEVLGMGAASFLLANKKISVVSHEGRKRSSSSMEIEEFSLDDGLIFSAIGLELLLSPSFESPTSIQITSDPLLIEKFKAMGDVRLLKETA